MLTGTNPETSTCTDLRYGPSFGMGIVFVGKGQVTFVDNIDMVAIGSTLSDTSGYD